MCPFYSSFSSEEIANFSVFFMHAVFLVLAIVIHCIIASKFKKISVSKGYTEKNHIFAFCFFFGIAAYIYVLALPDLTVKEQNRQIISLLSSSYTASNPPIGASYPEYTTPKKKFGLFKRR